VSKVKKEQVEKKRTEGRQTRGKKGVQNERMRGGWELLRWWEDSTHADGRSCYFGGEARVGV
jgi:hypothetical protein